MSLVDYRPPQDEFHFNSPGSAQNVYSNSIVCGVRFYKQIVSILGSCGSQVKVNVGFTHANTKQSIKKGA